MQVSTASHKSVVAAPRRHSTSQSQRRRRSRRHCTSATPPQKAAAASAASAPDDGSLDIDDRRGDAKAVMEEDDLSDDEYLQEARQWSGSLLLGGLGAVAIGSVAGLPAASLLLTSSAASAGAMYIAKTASETQSSPSETASRLLGAIVDGGTSAAWDDSEGLAVMDKVAFLDVDEAAVDVPEAEIPRWLDMAAPMQLAVGCAGIPRADKAAAGSPGEDASAEQRAGPPWRREHWLGVCDGVSAWSTGSDGQYLGDDEEESVDAGAYARELLSSAMSFAAEPEAAAAAYGMAKTMAADAKATGASPLTALSFAHLVTELPGSTTACLARVSLGDEDAWERSRQASEKNTEVSVPQPPSDASLSALNVGDSGFVVVRRGRIVYNCATASHTFNCPYQLGYEAYYPETDLVTDGTTSDVRLQRGDAVVMGTDGLFDNLYASDVAELTTRALLDTEDDGTSSSSDYTRFASARAQVAADHLLERASALSVDDEYISPFSRSYESHLRKTGGGFVSSLLRTARKLLRRKKKGGTVADAEDDEDDEEEEEEEEDDDDPVFVGGKQDDITVMVAFLV
ncbi:hypothetical protein PPROV_000589200 [Pycnococcus provasolii]|uniref:Protein phosphatase n=2 Tax=Pycnococcus provasolii TaxID=41880 RepID=A0A830HQ42_9CHLO|nr:hypothetical protein PPROV_000589200 [Pycnococcus provasolii]